MSIEDNAGLRRLSTGTPGMSWEQKFAALKALDQDASLRMRKPGDWYVVVRAEIGGDGMLHSATGNGTTPEQAIGEQWERLTNLQPEHYVSTNAMRSSRKHFRWNGFMWEELPQASQSEAA